MAFFVPAKNTKGKIDNTQDIKRPDLELLVIGKRMGLSFEEINELRAEDLIGFAEIYTGIFSESTREATQEDIDSFYSMM